MTGDREDKKVKTAVEILRKSCDGNRAYKNAERLSVFHRIPGTKGYEEAAGYTEQYLEAEQIPYRLLSFPADGKTVFLDRKAVRGWDCKCAWLELAGTEENGLRLADWSANPMSVIQRSGPGDYREQPLEIVMSDLLSGDETNLEGKLLYIHEKADKYLQWAVEEQKVAGIITDFMPEIVPVRHQGDIYDGTSYVSFPWTGLEEKNCIGFVLTPRMGRKLSEACRKQWEAFQTGGMAEPYVKARAYVDSEFFDGTFQVVEAEIAGKGEEAVVAAAHLCHPVSCANDNASGSAVLLEVVRVLKKLIGEGKLPQPRRTLRFIWGPEFLGTEAYLKRIGEKVSAIKGAVNLDMVGGMPEKTGAAFLFMKQPDSLPSVVYETASHVMDEACREMKMLALEGSVCNFLQAKVKFSPGSDNAVYSSPKIGIPCVTLTQWPDKFYHTSYDTIDKLDPAMLKRSCLICAACLYVMADLGGEDERWLFSQARYQLTEDVGKAQKKWLLSEARDSQTLRTELEELERRWEEEIDTAKGFWQADEKKLQEQKDYGRRLLALYLEESELYGAGREEQTTGKGETVWEDTY